MYLTLGNVQKIQVLNRYYRITKFYSFLKNISIKTAIFVGVLVLVYILLDYFFLDMEAIINSMAQKYSGWLLFPVFLISEAFLGLLPPELFIAWSSTTRFQEMNLIGLATMSYAGGVVAYYSGRLLYRIPSVAYYLENKMAKNILNLKKWGGVFVFTGAMLPLPHSIVSLACGLINYNINHYLFWALFRYLRFFLYALVIYNL